MASTVYPQNMLACCNNKEICFGGYLNHAAISQILFMKERHFLPLMLHTRFIGEMISIELEPLLTIIVYIGYEPICFFFFFFVCYYWHFWHLHALRNVWVWWYMEACGWKSTNLMRTTKRFFVVVAAQWINIYLSLNLSSVYNLHWMEKAKYCVVGSKQNAEHCL